MVPQPKALIDFEHGALTIDASVIGRGLDVEPSLVPVRMREGRITVLCERGYDEDAGRHRLTFEPRSARIAGSEGHRAMAPEFARSRTHPQSVVKRWQRETRHNGNGRCPPDLKRDAVAAWRRFVSCVSMLLPDQVAPLWESIHTERQPGSRVRACTS
jgi:hypothetical protein